MLFCLCGSAQAYSILIDASDITAEHVPDAINFIAETRDIPYRIVLPDAMEAWEKRIICVLAEKSEFSVVASLSPNVWMRGVMTLGVSDFRDILAGSLMKHSRLSGVAADEIFIGPQTPSDECFDILERAGIKTVFNIGEGGVFKHGPSAVNLVSCYARQDLLNAPEKPLYCKALSFDGLAEQLAENMPVKAEGAEPEVFSGAGGIVLSEINLKMWEHFAEARKRLERYKNSGRADRDMLSSALEKAYRIEDISNWTGEAALEDVFYAVAGIYEDIGESLPRNYASIAGMLFDELRELPISVSEDFFIYTLSSEDGYLVLDGSFAAPVSSSAPLEFYWWNPAAGYSTRRSLSGGDIKTPANFCVSIGDNSAFYRAGQNEWERMWSVPTVTRSSHSFSMSMPLTFMQLAERTNISFFISLSTSVSTRALAAALPASSVKKKWLDPVGDAKGPGWYVMPDGTAPGMCDIMSLSLRQSDSKADLQFYFAGPISGDGRHSGFDLYIDINGIKQKGESAARRGLNAFVQESAYWEFCLRVSSGSAKLISASGSRPIPVKFDSSLRIASVSITDFPYDMSACGLTFASYMLDEEGEVLEVKREKDDLHPGGGRPELKSPNVFDIITPGSLSQKRALGDYLKKRAAVIPILP